MRQPTKPKSTIAREKELRHALWDEVNLLRAWAKAAGLRRQDQLELGVA